MCPDTVTPRKHYQKRILRLLDNSNATLVLGLRRSGKSCIAAQLAEQLKRRFGDGGVVIHTDFEAPRPVYVSLDYMIERFDRIYDPDKKNVFLLDEIVHVDEWERAADYAMSKPNVKLIFFSSNRCLLSSDFAAYREGRCDIVEVLPLSMEEYISFSHISEITHSNLPFAKKRYRDPNGNELTSGELYLRYLNRGMLPACMNMRGDGPGAWIDSDGICSSIVLHDILETGSFSGASAVTDPALLRSIITVMARSMGENVSATWIGKQIPSYLDRPSSTKTVESYMRALINSHLFYTAQRFDIKAGQKLKTLSKYYAADSGICKYYLGDESILESRLLESRVFFELLRRGYTVYNGKFGQDEITFMAEDGDMRVYVQIAGGFDERTRRRVLSPLRRIKDDHPKVVISSESETRLTADGILIINAGEFLMGAALPKMK